MKPPPFDPNYKLNHPNFTSQLETRPGNKDGSSHVNTIGNTAYVHIDNWCRFPIYIYQTKKAGDGCGGSSNTETFTIPAGNNGGRWVSFSASPFVAHHF
jgi:hypothetical protein